MATQIDALVYQGGGRLDVERRPAPSPGPGEVAVEVAWCGICGTDLHLVLEDYARPGSVLGHEWSGHIVALGDGVDGWSLGDRVTAGPRPRCGRCRACRRGRPAVCWAREPTDYLSFTGAFAEQVTVEADRLVAIPDDVDDRAAALTEPLAVALHGLTLGAVTPDDRVLVTGAGPLGLLVVAALAARGVTDIRVSEPDDGRRARAGEVGGTRLLAPDELVRPPMGAPVADPVDVALDCSGHPDAISGALEQLSPGGTLVVLGTGGPEARLNHNRMIVQETTVLGAYNYDDGGFDDALALLGAGTLPIPALLDPDEVDLGGVGDAIRDCADRRRLAKVLVRPGGSP